jgi:uncharacterized membrane protein YtjA (UPF0391 family)
MVGWTLTFLTASVLAGIHGFVGRGRSRLNAGMAKALFFIFAILAVVSLLSREAPGS